MDDLKPGRAGVRAMALAPEGEMIDDFKIEVNGNNAHPIYKYLRDYAKNSEDISWNFEKFIITKDEKIYNFDPTKKVSDFEQIIIESL